MNKLNKMMKMQEKIAIFVPATNNVNEAIDNTRYVDHAIFILSDLFGGATAIQTTGGYVSDDGNLVKENTTMVYAFGNDIESKIDEVLTFCEYLQVELSQECIGLELNNSFYLVDTRENDMEVAI